MIDFKHLLGAACAATSLTCVMYGHAESANGVTFTPTVGYYMYDHDFTIDHHAVEGLALGYQTTGPMEYQLHYFTGSTEFSGYTEELDLEQAFLTATYHFNRKHRSHPYILLGGGRQTLETLRGDYIDSIALAGAGYQIALGNTVRLRPDVRAIYNTDIETTTAAFTLGLQWLIGGAPSTPEPSEPKSPPDTDQDGIPDSQDRCPGTELGNQVDANGCTLVLDSDNDGIPDSQDKCPETSESAKVDEEGCYIIITEAKEIQLYVTFENNSFTVAAASYKEIDKVAQFMLEYPLTRVVLAGHTDSTGSASYNQTLSLKRAQAVAQLLKDHFGISSKRIETVGYGESQPLYPNDTPQNRAANRRVTATVTAMVESIQK